MTLGKSKLVKRDHDLPAPTAIDRSISYLFPRWGVMRARARFQLYQYEKFRSYEAASKGRRTAGWKGTNASVNTEIRQSILALRAFSRQAIRNNEYCGRAQGAYVDNVVGTGIHLKMDFGSDRKEKEAMSLWREWALQSSDSDYHRVSTFHALQDILEHSLFEVGELFAVKRIIKGARIPLRIQLVEPDLVDVMHNEVLKSGNEVRQGIEFTPRGEIAAYWFFKDHPGDDYFNRLSMERVRIPADDVAHCYDVLRAGQLRGVPSEMARVLVRLNDLGDFEQGQMMKQKIAAAFAAFVYDNDGTGSDIATPGENAGSAAQEELEFDTLQPGIIQTLPAGKNVAFSDPPSVEGYGEFVGNSLHAVSAGTRVPYEILTHNYKDVNFSSARMSWNEFQRVIDRRQSKIHIPMFNAKIHRWWAEATYLATGKDFSDGVITWTPQRRFQVDPTKEIPIMVKEIRSGLQSYEGALIERGFDPEEKIREVKRGFEKMDEHGLVLDCDPRKKDMVGQTQEEDEKDAAGNSK